MTDGRDLPSGAPVARGNLQQALETAYPVVVEVHLPLESSIQRNLSLAAEQKWQPHPLGLWAFWGERYPYKLKEANQWLYFEEISLEEFCFYDPMYVGMSQQNPMEKQIKQRKMFVVKKLF